MPIKEAKRKESRGEKGLFRRRFIYVDFTVILDSGVFELGFRLKGLDSVFSRYTEVTVAYLFGSRARDDFNVESDIDIAVLLSQSLSGPYDFVRLVGESADELEVEDEKVNLVILNDASLELAYKVISEGKVIFERDFERRVEFEVHVLESYMDFKPVLDLMRRSLIEEYTHGEA